MVCIMRNFIPALALALSLALGACQTSEFDQWRAGAEKECNAKPRPIDRKMCLDQVDAVVRERTPGGVSTETDRGHGDTKPH
jgi:hypothetical protein